MKTQEYLDEIASSEFKAGILKVLNWEIESFNTRRFSAYEIELVVRDFAKDNNLKMSIERLLFNEFYSRFNIGNISFSILRPQTYPPIGLIFKFIGEIL